MESQTFSEQLEYEEKFKKICEHVGLEINPSSRLIRYFKNLRAIENARHEDEERFRYWFDQNKAENYYSLYYVAGICSLVDALREQNQDADIVRIKLKNLAKGRYLLSEENKQDSKARDTEFELNLFSYLVNKGSNANLCDPNPDFQMQGVANIYNFECKRPSRQESIQNNLRDAVNQHRKFRGANNVQVIALGLDQVLIKGDNVLDSENEKAAKKYIRRLMDLFHQENSSMIAKICADSPFLIAYYVSCLAGFRNNLPMTRAEHISLYILNFDDRMSSKIFSDFQDLTSGI